MLELAALLAVSLALVASRRRPMLVPAGMPTTFVLPAVEAPSPPRRRLARGSVPQPVTELPDELPRRRPVIRPSHARR